MKMTHLEKKVLAVVRTTVMDHDKVRLHYLSLVTQLDESRHRVLPCTQRKAHHQIWTTLRGRDVLQSSFSTEAFMMNIFVLVYV